MTFSKGCYVLLWSFVNLMLYFYSMLLTTPSCPIYHIYPLFPFLLEIITVLLLSNTLLCFYVPAQFSSLSDMGFFLKAFFFSSCISLKWLSYVYMERLFFQLCEVGLMKIRLFSTSLLVLITLKSCWYLDIFAL